jgi:hypothetical protein
LDDDGNDLGQAGEACPPRAAFHAGAMLVPIIIAGARSHHHPLGTRGLESVLSRSSEQQDVLLDAVPDLGAEDETGHGPAVDHVALSNLDDDDHNDVMPLAAAYRDHFGFPLTDNCPDADPIAAAPLSRLSELH